MYLTVSPIREDRLGRKVCERCKSYRKTPPKAAFLVMFRKSAHPSDSKPDVALCDEHAHATVNDMMIYMDGYKEGE